MPFSLQFNYPIFSISCSHQLTLYNTIKNQPFKFLCTSPQSEEAAKDSSGYEKENGKGHVILVEKYRNGTSKRYIIDNDSEIKMFLEEHVPGTIGSQHLEIPVTELSWLPKVIKDFVLPAGFPDTVTDDYLDYMLLQFPTNVTGWICHTLVTSSLLKAVGVGSFSGTSAAASAAAIRWVSKDGIGAVGRFFIGGRFGNLFDDDPKQWRMYADFIGSAGSIFDLCTPLYPSYFLPLASLGNLAKAVARGLKDPSFRVIQNHFAITGNLGDVAAKEEVWEVAAELVGLALGILALVWHMLLHMVYKKFNTGYTWYLKVLSYIGTNMVKRADLTSLVSLSVSFSSAIQHDKSQAGSNISELPCFTPYSSRNR
uniref:Protein root UVB sensitive 5-like isoform X6 n=1 Tax=Nicotiana tabacum TaxID=4097 RepID=A0A1S3YGI5_TOBAC|nr:PREDICTED: protein root UVB sensitive 5-like isoform X6 [Nicotiana tabacum]